MEHICIAITWIRSPGTPVRKRYPKMPISPGLPIQYPTTMHQNPPPPRITSPQSLNRVKPKIERVLKKDLTACNETNENTLIWLEAFIVVRLSPNLEKYGSKTNEGSMHLDGMPWKWEIMMEKEKKRKKKRKGDWWKIKEGSRRRETNCETKKKIEFSLVFRFFSLPVSYSAISCVYMRNGRFGGLACRRSIFILSNTEFRFSRNEFLVPS